MFASARGETLQSERCGVATLRLPRGVVRLRSRFDTPRPSLLRLWGRRTEPEALKSGLAVVVQRGCTSS